MSDRDRIVYLHQTGAIFLEWCNRVNKKLMHSLVKIVGFCDVKPKHETKINGVRS